jgi:hypothetical protein
MTAVLTTCLCLFVITTGMSMTSGEASFKEGRHSLSLGQAVTGMMASGRMARNTAQGQSSGPMETATRVTSKRTESVAEEL